MQVDPRARFDNYVVGSANRLAVAAARNVAEAPGSVYNPLFVYSSSGLGKTHLIGASGNPALQPHPELRVQYAPLEDFGHALPPTISPGALARASHGRGSRRGRPASGRLLQRRHALHDLLDAVPRCG